MILSDSTTTYIGGSYGIESLICADDCLILSEATERIADIVAIVLEDYITTKALDNLLTNTSLQFYLVKTLIIQ